MRWQLFLFSMAIAINFAFPGWTPAQTPSQTPPPIQKPPAQEGPQTPPPIDEALPWQPGLGIPNSSPATQPPDAAPGIRHALPVPIQQTLVPGSSLPSPQNAPANNINSAPRDPSIPVALQGPGQANVRIPAAPLAGIGDPRFHANSVAGGGQEVSVVVPAAMLSTEPAASGETPAAATSAENQNDQTQNPVADLQITGVTKGMEVLPNSAGQIWRSYDITPYTHMISNTSRPQQAIVDWIVKETGTQLWFTEPMGVLNATRDQLHIYHTPEIQSRVKSIIDRFVYTRGQAHVMGLRMVTVANPNWRASAFSMMQPVQVQSPGVEAWLVSKESAAVLANHLRNRADYQEHSVGDLSVADGQKYVLSRTRPFNFIRSLTWVNDGIGRYQPINNRIDEGYSLEFSSLRSIDSRSIEAIISCSIDQIEKMQSVSIDLPVPGSGPQTVELQVPQMVSWRLEERFRWPSDQVLVLSCGVVATPGPQRQALLGIPSMFNGTTRRADALLFVEYKGPAPPREPVQSANSGNPAAAAGPLR